MDVEAVADLAVGLAQGLEQGPVFAHMARRQAADTAVGGDGDGRAGAAVLVVPGPGVVDFGIDPRHQFGDELLVFPFHRAALENGGRQLHQFGRIGHDVAGDRVHAAGDLAQVGGDPVLDHQGVGVGGQHHPVGGRQVRRGLHGQAPRPAGVGVGVGQVDGMDLQPERQFGGEIADQLERAVAAIVEQQHDRNIGEIDIHLGRQGLQARPDALFLVLDRNGDDHRNQARGRGSEPFDLDGKIRPRRCNHPSLVPSLRGLLPPQGSEADTLGPAPHAQLEHGGNPDQPKNP